MAGPDPRLINARIPKHVVSDIKTIADNALRRQCGNCGRARAAVSVGRDRSCR